ncbi:MAG: hypothetical protein CMP14_01510 [Rickettsiales bacterium]|nr:hypothetical protein [Rickettsiales bacterium]
MTKYHSEKTDLIVENVVEKFHQRSRKGIEHYGITMDENPKSALAWVDDAQEELMDAILYLESLKQNLTRYAYLYDCCPTCEGRGRVWVERQGGQRDVMRDCFDCGGGGRI